jgi:hypothetical protein
LGGAPLAAAIADARSALRAGGAVSSDLDIGLQCRTPGLRYGSEQMVSAIPTLPRAAKPAAEQAPAVLKQQALLEEVVRSELSRKRLANAFDVFLCYNSSDKAAVKQIAQQLQVRGILPWLDEWELPPGQPWQPLLEQQIGGIKSAAVFVGADGVGPWQEQELYGFLREFTSRRAPVIPVLLLNAPEKPKLPVFLSAMTWVEFRKIDPDPLAQLIWGITGQRVHQ